MSPPLKPELGNVGRELNRLRERNAVLTVRSNATEVENRNLRRLVEDYLAGHGRWANGHECQCPMCERARDALGKPKQENLPL